MAYRAQINQKRYSLSQSPASKAARRGTFLSRRLTVLCGCACGAEITLSPSALARRKTGRVFLNRDHYETWFRGENVTALWQGGTSNGYYGPNWPIQRKRALARDRVCRECTATTNLVVHHRVYFHTFERSSDANRLENLITLCRTCHGRAHATDRASVEAVPQSDHPHQ
jgi:5-methylcytosine-specific restriction endonuclease McrA